MTEESNVRNSEAFYNAPPPRRINFQFLINIYKNDIPYICTRNKRAGCENLYPTKSLLKQQCLIKEFNSRGLLLRFTHVVINFDAGVGFGGVNIFVKSIPARYPAGIIQQYCLIQEHSVIRQFNQDLLRKSAFFRRSAPRRFSERSEWKFPAAFIPAADIYPSRIDRWNALAIISPARPFP